jgi:tetratricopeptide (TPR) repeat protein
VQEQTVAFDPDVQLNQARLALEEGRLETALARMEELLGEVEASKLEFPQLGNWFQLAGHTALELSRIGRAEEYLQKALETLDDEHDLVLVLQCQLDLAECVSRHGNLRKARYLAELVARQAEKADEPRLAALAEAKLGTLRWQEGEYETACIELQLAIDKLRRLGDDLNAAKARSSLGVALNLAGNIDEARSMFQAALVEFQQQQKFTLMVRTLNNLAGLAFMEKDWDRAREYLLDCLKYEHDIQNRSDMALSLFNLGLVELYEHNMKPARKYLLRAFQLAQDVGDRIAEASALMQLGVIAIIEHNAPDAMNYLRLAGQALEGLSNSLTATLPWYDAVFQLTADQESAAREIWDNRPHNPEPESLMLLLRLIDIILSAEFQAENAMNPGSVELIRAFRSEIETVLAGDDTR